MFKGLWFFIVFGWRHEKRYIIYLVLNQFISSMIPLVAVIMPRYIINELMGEQRPFQLLLYIGILAGYTFAASAASSWLGWRSFTHRIAKVDLAFNMAMHERTVKADYANIESSAYLEMKEKAEKFLFGNMNGFSYVLDRAVAVIGKSFTMIGVVAVIASLHPMMMLLFIALVLAASFVESRVQRKQAEMNIQMLTLNRRTGYYGEVLESFSYGKDIRVNNLGDWLLGREKEHWERGHEMYITNSNLGIKSAVFTSFTSLLQQILSYGYLAAQVTTGAITIGDFSMYAGGVAAFSSAMRGLMQNIVEVAEFRKYYTAIEEYLNIPAKMREGRRLPIPEGEHRIEFRDVSFSYPGQTGYALSHINITLNPGEKISVIGENGAGKSTFIKLLCRIYDPTEGMILIDGMDIRDIDYDQYMALFSTVFQDYRLFALSLKDNVALAKSDAVDDAAVEEALRKAGFGEKLADLPKGIKTLVYRNFDGEGFEPSGGEGQKIALARALFKDAPIVVLDEPTAALDPRAEYEMYQHFNELVANKTAVYISHRLSSARFCDRIIVFAGGELVEDGTHDILMRQGGRYAELFKMQAQYYEGDAGASNAKM